MVLTSKQEGESPIEWNVYLTQRSNWFSGKCTGEWRWEHKQRNNRKRETLSEKLYINIYYNWVWIVEKWVCPAWVVILCGFQAAAAAVAGTPPLLPQGRHQPLSSFAPGSWWTHFVLWDEIFVWKLWFQAEKAAWMWDSGPEVSRARVGLILGESAWLVLWFEGSQRRGRDSTHKVVGPRVRWGWLGGCCQSWR